MIKTFGGEAEELQTCEFLHFIIETESTYPDLSLTSFVVPTICQPLKHQTPQAAQEIYHHLEGLNLADLNTGEEELEVDILVGSDQYWNLITGGVRRGDSGPNAMGTKVGWVLSGPVTDPVSEKSSVNLVNTHRRTGRGGRGGQLPPKKIRKSKSRANVQHKSGEKWEIKKRKSPQFVGQTKAVGQYSLHSRAILAYFDVPKKFVRPKKIFGPLKWYTVRNIFGQISFCPPNFFLPVRPCEHACFEVCNTTTDP
jgi:hypothetical protein